MTCWPMPDVLLVDCYERIAALSNNPAEQLVRLERPFDGMALVFDLIDSLNRLAVRRFGFLVVKQDGGPSGTRR